jgi:chromosomal replication initiation ATPase DnaA
MQTIDITPTPTPTRTPRRHPLMPPNSPATTRRASQRAAIRRLQRAQLAEARRIRQTVADAYTLTPALLRCPRRPALLAEARQVAMYLMRLRLRWPLPARTTAFPCTRIGRLLGGRDHATVMHGVAVIAVRLVSGREEDASLRQIVRALGATLDATYEATGRRHGRAA